MDAPSLSVNFFAASADTSPQHGASSVCLRGCESRRLFNAAGQLLFVGCAQSRTRLQAHLCRGSWQAEIAGVHVREFTTLNDALADEAAALVAEAPLHNVPEDRQ